MSDVVHALPKTKPARITTHALHVSLEEEKALRSTSYAALLGEISQTNEKARLTYGEIDARLKNLAERITALEHGQQRDAFSEEVNERRIRALETALTNNATKPVQFATWRKLVREVAEGVTAGANATLNAIREKFGSDAARSFKRKLSAAADAYSDAE